MKAQGQGRDARDRVCGSFFRAGSAEGFGSCLRGRKADDERVGVCTQTLVERLESAPEGQPASVCPETWWGGLLAPCTPSSLPLRVFIPLWSIESSTLLTPRENKGTQTRGRGPLPQHFLDSGMVSRNYLQHLRDVVSIYEAGVTT